jgi:hypothetical protein
MVDTFCRSLKQGTTMDSSEGKERSETKKESIFFFEKKKQKTFRNWSRAVASGVFS